MMSPPALASDRLARKREQRAAIWAKLALTEAGTRLADRRMRCRDEVARHHDDKALATLVIQIALINAFSRLNATTRQMVGAWGQALGKWSSATMP